MLAHRKADLMDRPYAPAASNHYRYSVNRLAGSVNGPDVPKLTPGANSGACEPNAASGDWWEDDRHAI
jgi:hypothetical protein